MNNSVNNLIGFASLWLLFLVIRAVFDPESLKRNLRDSNCGDYLDKAAADRRARRERQTVVIPKKKKYPDLSQITYWGVSETTAQIMFDLNKKYHPHKSDDWCVGAAAWEARQTK